MGYIGTLLLYSTLLAFGYAIALFRRGKEVLKNGVTLHGKLPPLRPLYVHAFLSLIFKPKRLPPQLLSAGSMPTLSVVSENVTVNADNLTAYKKKCGLTASKSLPILYPTVETFCLNLACMCLPQFPISVLGGVLARYTAIMYKPVQQAEPFTYR